jgi:hypothetical protein
MDCDFVCCTVVRVSLVNGLMGSATGHDIRATNGKKQFLLLHFGVFGLYWTWRAFSIGHKTGQS